MSKILLLEDDATMKTLLRTLLEMEGYAVSLPGAEPAEALLEIIRQEKPDIALLDVHLRSANGLDLLRLVRADPALKDLSILMTSGTNLKYECMNAGADAFLMKPFMPEDLFRLIKQILN